MFDTTELLQNGLVIIKRNEEKEIIPYSSHLDKISDEEIYIRCGQLDSNNKLDGIGRKITLRPIYYRKCVTDFTSETTYIEEGEFKNDELDCTFGRRIHMRDGSNVIGWFNGSGNYLHGYGKDVKSS